MKLTDLAIDGIGVCNNINLSRLADGLNLIYGENGSGKSTIRRYLRGVMFGYNEPFWNSFLDQHRVGSFAGTGGQVLANTRIGNVTISRPIQRAGGLEVRNAGRVQSVSISDLVPTISAETYDAFYNVDLQDRTEQAFRAADQLQRGLGVRTGLSRWATDAEYQSWRIQADSRLDRLESLRLELSNATSERGRLVHEIEAAQVHYSARIQALDVEISDATNAVNVQLDAIAGLRQNIESIDVQISQLQATIDNAASNVKYVSNPPLQPDRLAVLYERLDEIDNQISRWRRVQTDIQNQRIRLRDEMVVWNDLTLESEEHPYFRAREILVDLESRLDDVENQARHWESGGNRADPITHAKSIVSSCGQMREELYALCQELGSQYKHIRHKAAVAELKQLRRCYNEMGENIKRLINRRENTISDIRQLDPAGADAIMRAENQFCECARHEGFLEARRRYVGSLQLATTPQVDYTVVHPDQTLERERLSKLQGQRHHLISQSSVLDGELNQRESIKARLIAERERISLDPSSEIQFKISQLDSVITRLNGEINTLQVTVDEDRRMGNSKPNATITLASQYLQRMSEGDLCQVWLTDDSARVQVSDRRGSTIPLTALGPGDQHLVTLSLCLAGVVGSKTAAPVMLDDVFANIDSPRAVATSMLLSELGRQGLQILAFTCHRAMLDQVTQNQIGAFTTFELPTTTVSPAPVITPERTPYLPPTRTTETSLVPDFTRPPALNTYPYVKYPVSGNTLTNQVEHPQRDLREASLAAMDRANHASYEPQPSVPFTNSHVQSVVLRETSHLNEVGFLDTNLVHALNSLGIRQVNQLLNLDPDHLPVEFTQLRISPDQVDRWQAQCWMMVCVPAMNYSDAEVLVASGIHEPEQLDTTPYDQLVSRVTRYLDSTEGRRDSAGYLFDRSRVDRWYDALRTTRDQWRRDRGYSRRHRRKSVQETRSEAQHEPRVSLRPSFDDKAKVATPTKTTRANSSRSNGKARSSLNNSTGSTLKFYLELTDHIEAAPSIGPRTAERFEKISVVTIADFLRQTAESMASKINYKRISAEVIRQWQSQTRLVCRIPNLRGHDAQLLVACGITDPEELATMKPEKVYGIVGPFSETKEGLKIIRSGKKPDLAEVKDWIDWAANHRNLQAA